VKKRKVKILSIKNKKHTALPYKTSFIVLIFSVFTLFLVGQFFGSKKTLDQSSPCANSISCINDLSGKYESNKKEGEFMGKKVGVPKESDYLAMPVLGEKTGADKRIYVDLTNQRLYAFEGEKLIYNYLVSTGKWGKTPTGDFEIWVKLRYTTMSGGNSRLNTYYYLPNVPYVMFFYNDSVSKSRGFSLHGAYWHNNFGQPMSHGCVNMKPDEAEKIYYWVDPPTQGNTTHASKENPGTIITIYGEAPAE